MITVVFNTAANAKKLYNFARANGGRDVELDGKTLKLNEPTNLENIGLSHEEFAAELETWDGVVSATASNAVSA